MPDSPYPGTQEIMHQRQPPVTTAANVTRPVVPDL